MAEEIKNGGQLAFGPAVSAAKKWRTDEELREQAAKEFVKEFSTEFSALELTAVKKENPVTIVAR